MSSEPTPNDPTSDSPASSGFAKLKLPSNLHKALDDLGYVTPSPIQAQAIPVLLQGRDVLGVAQTGTGKTAAFALPTLAQVDLTQHTPQVLCLAPTRELAIQVADAFRSYAKYLKKLSVLPIYGGTSYRDQLHALKRGVQVIVGTPGRVMDHIRRGSLVLDHVNMMILDEADEMLSMGFIEDIEWILEQLPEKHQTALFSATMPPRIQKIVATYLTDPAHITIASKKANNPSIRQHFLQAHNRDKMKTLLRILQVEEFDAMLVFVRTKQATLEVAEQLQTKGYSAEALNGDIPQNQREKTVNRLKRSNIDIIVATDVAARGLDVERVSHVINYDAPFDTESYVHRIGRTGRAGRKGDAILFITRREKRMLHDIERATQKRLEQFQFPTVDELNDRKLARFFKAIDKTLAMELKEYESAIKKYLRQKEDEVDPLQLAAALACLGADHQPFYIKEAPKPPRQRPLDRGPLPEHRARRERDRSGQYDSRRNRNKPHHSRHEEIRDKRDFRHPDFATETYRLEVGEDHGVSKGDIVGAIANEAGISSKHMGKIRIYQEYSLIELPEHMPPQINQMLKKVWLCGRQLQISKSGSIPPAEHKAHRFRDYKNKKKHKRGPGGPPSSKKKPSKKRGKSRPPRKK